MYEYKCKMVRVVDGDTVDVDIDLGFGVWMRNQRIRMYGIDTPESRTRDLDEKARGKLAAQYIIDHVDNGDEVVIKTEKDGKGKFGRILGKIFIDGKNINQSMIDEHLAVEYFGQSKSAIENEHLVNRQILIDEGKYSPVE